MFDQPFLDALGKQYPERSGLHHRQRSDSRLFPLPPRQQALNRMFVSTMPVDQSSCQKLLFLRQRD
jgi:hypothetical protein